MTPLPDSTSKGHEPTDRLARRSITEPDLHPIEAQEKEATLDRQAGEPQASPESSRPRAADEGTRIATLLLSDLVGSSALVERTGDAASAELFQQHDRLARDLLEKHGGLEIDKTDGFLLLFDRPWQAVLYALDFHRALAELSRAEDVDLESRVGIHLGEIVLRRNPPEDVARGAKPLEVEGLAKPTAARLMSVAGGRQTLMTQAAFDLARRSAVGSAQGAESLQWLAHGSYLFKGVEEPVEVFEVGVGDIAPLAAPESSEKVTRVADEDAILGWRPATGLEIPFRPNWVVGEKLGEGGFGEVWVGEHKKSGEQRVYKFCYETERLHSLQREITVFRLLKEELGLRDDIARILDWNLDEAPYFIEFVYIEGGSLVDWADAQGGIGELPMADRLEIVAQVATALAAAHSVGVLHKDIKPANVLMTTDRENRPRAVLTDFGIGLITDQERLAAKGITVLGLHEPDSGNGGDSTAGTQIYLAPELLAGQPSTIQADIYALGVMLYQMVVGDLGRPLAQGWQRRVEDVLLREDIAALVDGSPARRPSSAAEVAQRLRTLEERRTARAIEEQTARAAERAKRRRKVLTTVAAVSSVFLVVVSFLAIQAIRAHGEADRRRGQAEQLIDFMLNDLHEGLERIGRLDLLESVARGSQEHFNTLSSQDEMAGDVHRRGITLLNIGDVLFEQGDAEAALASHRSALRLFENAAAREPSREDWQEGAVEAKLRIAAVLGAQKKSDSAMEILRSALGQAEALSVRLPEDRDRRFAFARARYGIADLETQMGNSKAALDSLRATIDLGEELTRSGGEFNWRHSLLLLDARVYLANVLRSREEREAAVEAYREALLLVDQVVALDPGNALWRQRLAWIHFQSGFLRWRQGELALAVESLERARSAYADLATTDPTRVAWRSQLGEVTRVIGMIQWDLGQDEAALSKHRDALEIIEKLVAEDPTRLSWLPRLSRIHQGIALNHLKRGRASAALEPGLAGHALREQVAAAAGDDPSAQEELAWSHMFLGDIYAAQGKRERARHEWTRAVEIIAPITAQTDDMSYLSLHAENLLKLGRVDEARPLVEDLLARGFEDPDLLELMRSTGLMES